MFRVNFYTLKKELLSTSETFTGVYESNVSQDSSLFCFYSIGDHKIMSLYHVSGVRSCIMVISLEWLWST
jgi:hypothetical protein